MSLTNDGIFYNGTNVGKILYLEIDKENLSRGITFKILNQPNWIEMECMAKNEEIIIESITFDGNR